MSLIKKTVIAFVMWLPLSAIVAQEGLAIKELMTTAELEATGVGSLSEAEQKALSAWLIKFQQGETSSPQTNTITAQSNQAAPVAQPLEEDDDWRRRSEKIDFVTRIVGEFSGWEGDTQFNLENGQVWVQRRTSRWKTELQNPEVRVYQTFLGAFEMEVIETGRSVGVRRIR